MHTRQYRPCGTVVIEGPKTCGKTATAVIEATDGQWAAFEVKLGERWVEQGARNLRRLADRIKMSRHLDPEPCALAVIVSNGYGYTGKSDVGVIPVGALGP